MKELIKKVRAQIETRVSFPLQRCVMRRRERIEERKAAAKRKAKYHQHEADWKERGDTRCDYYKLVDKCCILEINLEISNPGRCENPNHTQGSRPQQFI